MYTNMAPEYFKHLHLFKTNSNKNILIHYKDKSHIMKWVYMAYKKNFELNQKHDPENKYSPPLMRLHYKVAAAY